MFTDALTHQFQNAAVDAGYVGAIVIGFYIIVYFGVDLVRHCLGR